MYKVQLGANNVQQILRLFAVQKSLANSIWLGTRNEADKALKCNSCFCKITARKLNAKNALGGFETEIAAIVRFAFLCDYGLPVSVGVFRNSFGFRLKEHVRQTLLSIAFIACAENA
jgi:hypothetical protein